MPILTTDDLPSRRPASLCEPCRGDDHTASHGLLGCLAVVGKPNRDFVCRCLVGAVEVKAATMLPEAAAWEEAAAGEAAREAGALAVSSLENEARG